MLLEQFLLAGDVATIAFGSHILAHGLDRRARDDVAADGRLNRHLEHLSRNQITHPLGQLPAPVARLGAMHDDRQRIHTLAVDQQIQAHQIRHLETLELIVERSITTTHRLQLIEEIEHHLAERQFVNDRYLISQILQLELHPATLLAQREHPTHVFLRAKDVRLDDGLADLGHFVDRRQLGRVVDVQHFPGVREDLIDHRRRSGDQIQVVLALQAFLDDLHMEHAQKAASKPESQGGGCLGLEMQRRIIQTQFLQGIAQVLVIVAADRIKTREHPRLDLFESGQACGAGAIGQGHRVPHRGAIDFLDAGNQETHLAGLQTRSIKGLGRKNTHAGTGVAAARRHHHDLVSGRDAAVDHADQRHHADEVVEPRVDDQRLQRRIGIALRRRNPRQQGFQQILHPDAGLGAHLQGIMGIDPDDIFDFLCHAIRIGLRQVDLVEHRDHFQPLIQCGVAIRDTLRFDALRGIHHQQGAFAGGQRAGNLVGKIDVPRCIDQIELVGLSITRPVGQGDRLRLDGDPAFTLQIHRVEHLRLHLAVAQTTTQLNEPISQRGFAVVDVGNDRKITGMRLHRAQFTSARPAARSRTARTASRSSRASQITRPSQTSTGTRKP